jgi:hypothetical protein
MANIAQFMTFGPFFSAGALVTAPKLYHYSAGTLTLKDVWTTRTKSATAAQPVVGDANGIVSCFADGLYKFIVKDSSDVTLYTWDNVAVATGGVLYGEGTAIASSTTLTLGVDGDFFHVTGSSSQIGTISGDQATVTLVFDSTPTLTHGANLILQNSIDYTAAAGDVLVFVNEGSGVWRELSRRPVSSNVIFPSTQSASSNANTLDDYEEGTWTPSVGGSATYTTQLGTYTKVGRLVTLTGNLTINSIGTGSTSSISGLPFASGATYTAVGAVVFTTLSSNVVSMVCRIIPSSSTVDLWSLTAAGTSMANAGFMGNSTVMLLTITYHV